jgi:hypothetical protein
MSESEEREWLARSRADREWMKTDLGQLFVAFEDATARAWQLDTTASFEDRCVSDKWLTEVWERQVAARRALIKAIGGPE